MYGAHMKINKLLTVANASVGQTVSENPRLKSIRNICLPGLNILLVDRDEQVNLTTHK